MRRLQITLCGAALALLLGLGVIPVQAATFVVTNLADSGAGSLRQAILDANAAAGADTISFSVSGTITLASVLDIRDTLVIDGNGQSVTISGGNAVPVMSTVVNSPTLTLNSLTIANGRGSFSAAGVFAGGSLNVANCVFSGNSSLNSGAIQTLDALTVTNSRFTGNSGNGASAIYGGLTTTITNSTFEANVGPSGAVRADGGAR